MLWIKRLQEKREKPELAAHNQTFVSYFVSNGMSKRHIYEIQTMKTTKKTFCINNMKLSVDMTTLLLLLIPLAKRLICL